jgi:hypothetical protein
MLTVAISNSEEVAVLQTTEVGHSDPSILINLVRVARGKTCLSSECEFSNAIGKHLLGIWTVVWILGNLLGSFAWLGFRRLGRACGILGLRVIRPNSGGLGLWLNIRLDHTLRRDDRLGWTSRLRLVYALWFLLIPSLVSLIQNIVLPSWRTFICLLTCQVVLIRDFRHLLFYLR